MEIDVTFSVRTLPAKPFGGYGLFAFLYFRIVIFSIFRGTESACLTYQDNITDSSRYSTVHIHSNGYITEQTEIDIPLKWSDHVRCFKIKYMSDGYQVIGFIVKPTGKAKMIGGFL